MSSKKLFQNANDFSLFIEQKALDDDTTCHQALISFCEDEDIEIEDISKSINKQLKEKIAVEFADLGLLKSSPSLYD
ncbi:MAG: late promoter transcription accessory protein [Desulfuromonadaceae bacterium]